MIITLVGADFSENKIGTLDTWTIRTVLGNGATCSNSTTFVDRNAAYSATVTITEGYELGSAGVTVTMGGNAVTEGITVNGNTITINIASVTGNVKITVPTKSTSTGEEDDGDIPVTTLLDTICYENLTYREIFIDNNIAPNINNNTWDSELGTYPTVSGLTIEAASAEANCVPTYSIKVDGSSSKQSKGVADGKTHFAACNIKVTRYNKGNIGLFTDDETSICTLSKTTSGYETVVGKSTKANRGFYVGSVNSADLTGYINNPVIVPTDIFTTVPTVEQFTEWYNVYNDYLIENSNVIVQPNVLEVTSLDDVIYENLTCRDIFVNNNYAPDVNNNSYISVKTGGTFVPYQDQSVPIVAETATTNCAPTYSLKAEGATSQQIFESSKKVPAGTYYFAYNINVLSYSKGYFGMMFDGNSSKNVVASSEATALKKVTSGFETKVVKYKSTCTDELYLGSISSASGSALINNPVLVSSSIFTIAPTSNQFKAMFERYNTLLAG